MQRYFSGQLPGQAGLVAAADPTWLLCPTALVLINLAEGKEAEEKRGALDQVGLLWGREELFAEVSG